MKARLFRPAPLLFALLVAFAPLTTLQAARISDISEVHFAERALRFFLFQDASLRYALIGSVLLGLLCGLMGSFLVVRRLALLGDALSHAVLPGVAIGFLWSMSRNPLAIFIGATIAGLLGALVVQIIISTTRQKEDAALGFVLAAFFAVGVCLLTRIQNLPGSNKSGLNSFLFGQAAAMGRGDILLLAGIATITLLLLFLFYKEFLAASFDAGFARASGLRVRFFQGLLMVLVAFAIVAALQAVGVVLVAAMLVIPASTALLLTGRFHKMLILSCALGVVSGALGAFFSYVGGGVPTGPVMVLSAAAVFTVAFLAAPRHGVIVRVLRQWQRDRRIQRENSLKAIYRVFERRGFQGTSFSLEELAAERHEPIPFVAHLVRSLARQNLAVLNPKTQQLTLTPTGWKRACEIIRNHRLWELYLNEAANIPADHVHDEAELIEHILGDKIIKHLERRLNHARRDPHGKLIPGLEDIHALSTLTADATASQEQS